MAEASFDEIVRQLQCGKSGCACKGGRRVHCPAHHDADPDLVIRKGDQQPVVFNCKAGCTGESVVQALTDLGLWHKPDDRDSDAAPRPVQKKLEPEPPPTRGVPHGAVLEAEYDYGDAMKARFRLKDGTKTFRWRLPDGTYDKGLGDSNLEPKQFPLYRLAEVLAADPEAPVYICEGEKAADAARAAGLNATTLGGGGGQRDFPPKPLKPLAGRTVMLWPDNDRVGWEYMTALQGALAEQEDTKIGWVLVDVPRKGDAADYFAAGGKVEGLDDTAGPRIQALDTDSWTVWMPSAEGPIEFVFKHAIAGPRKAVDCMLEVIPHSYKARGRSVSQRIDLFSSTKEQQLGTKCRSLYKGLLELEWTREINDAFVLARSAWGSRHEPVEETDIVDDGYTEARWHVDGFLLWGLPTILFGDGSAGKGHDAIALSVCIASGTPWLGREVVRTPVLYIDWEADEQTFRRRVKRHKAGLGIDSEHRLGLFYLDAMGTPLPDMIERIRDIVQAQRIGMVVIDSAAPAAGADAETAFTANIFFAMLKSLPEVTKLIIAHVTKGVDRDGKPNKAATMKPFGSAFWHNLARMTWYVERTQEEGEGAIYQTLYNRKPNETARQPNITVTTTFGDDGGAISQVDGFAPGGAPAPSFAEPASALLDRIADALETHGAPITIHDLRYALDPHCPYDEEPRDDLEEVRRALQTRGDLFAKVSETAEGAPLYDLAERAPQLLGEAHD